MKYYVVSDVHGYFSLMKQALQEKGFFDDKEPHKLILCGDIYFAFNTRINECKNHHGFVGTDICPACGEGVHDTYQRIVGYLVPTRAYSKDRFKEFTTRQWYEYAEMLRE